MKKKQKNKKNKIILFFTLILVIVILLLCFARKEPTNTPEATLKTYMSYILEQNYEGMYELLSNKTKQEVEKETYLSRNKNIYEGNK